MAGSVIDIYDKFGGVQKASLGFRKRSEQIEDNCKVMFHVNPSSLSVSYSVDVPPKEAETTGNGADSAKTDDGKTNKEGKPSSEGTEPAKKPPVQEAVPENILNTSISFDAYFDVSNLYYEQMDARNVFGLQEYGIDVGEKVSELGQKLTSKIATKIVGFFIDKDEKEEDNKKKLQEEMDKMLGTHNIIGAIEAGNLFAANSDYYKLQTAVAADYTAILTWGPRVYCGKITNLKTDFVFFSKSGAPLQAKVSITMSAGIDDSERKKFKENHTIFMSLKNLMSMFSEAKEGLAEENAAEKL